MPFNVPDTFHILSSDGTVMAPKQIPYGANVTNVDVGCVYTSVPSEIVRAQRIGTWVVSHHGTRGTLKAQVIVGATGSVLMLGMLSVSRSNLDFLVQITLDDENRPECQIDAYGTTVAEWGGAGSTIVEGTPIEVVLKWDANTASFSGLHAEFTVNGAVPGGSWSTTPSSPWDSQLLENFQAGWAPATWSDFNGTMRILQLGEQY